MGNGTGQILLGVVLKVLAVSSSFSLTLFASRWVGAEAAAPFFWLLSTANVIAVVAVLGTDTLLIQQVSRHSELAMQVTMMRDRGLINTLKISSAIGLLALLLLRLSGVEILSGPSLILVPLLVIALSAISTLGGALKGGGDYFYSTVLHGVLLPLATLVLIRLFGGAISDATQRLPFAYTAAALALAFLVWKRSAGINGPAAIRPNWSPLLDVDFLRLGIPFATTPLLNVCLQFLPAVMLGFLAPPIDVSVYFAALRVSLVGALVLSAVNLVVGPKMSRFYSQEDWPNVQHLYNMTIIIGAAAAAPLSIMVVIFAGPILGVFDPSFSDASLVLQILILGQFVNSASGSVLMVLAMADQQSSLAKLNLIILALALTSGLVLMPLFGALGAAVVNCAALTVQNVAGAYICRRSLGLSMRFWSKSSQTIGGGASGR